MASPLLQMNLNQFVFYELSPSVMGINIHDAMATFYSYVGKQWIEKCSPFMVNSAGLFPKSRVSFALSANELVGNVLISVFFSFQAEKCWKGSSIGSKSVEGGHINKNVQEKNVQSF